VKFSILLPTRNRLQLLQYAVESVRRQDFSDWEIVVSDNASTEDVRGFVARLDDPRTHYVRTDSFVSVTDNWNNALRASTGDYVIMLGDDDALMPGYFSQLAHLIEKHEAPDLIYTDAYQYAYPNVMPGHPSGFIQQGYAEFITGRARTEPFWLPRAEAFALVAKSMSFRISFGFNMQHYVVSRRMVNALSSHGEFYESPFPDYYAANALLLLAENVLVVPHPLIVIGISPKSFGYYFFNGKESEGNSFLKNLPDSGLKKRLENVVLPGSSLLSSWLYAMESIQQNLECPPDIAIDYRRYRLNQVHFVYLQEGLSGVRELLPRLTAAEILECGLLACLRAMTRWTSGKLKRELRSTLRKWIGVFPDFDTNIRDVPSCNILEMIDLVATTEADGLSLSAVDRRT